MNSSSGSLFTTSNINRTMSVGSGTKGTDGLIITTILTYLVLALNSKKWGYKMALMGTFPIAVMTVCKSGIFGRVPINNLLVPLVVTTGLFSIFLAIDKKSKAAFENPLEAEHKQRAIVLYISYLVLFNIVFFASDRLI